ncbi:MAG: hypothetical protein K8I30_16740 [Anaerolineae bacterium]|nr:hypothetical protein [Anaerolineae bacterium]
MEHYGFGLVEMKSMDGNRIKAVTSVGISYLNDEGFAQFIDFAECYANYVQMRTSPEYWEQLKRVNNKSDADWEWHIERVKKWKEIGIRQPLTPPWADGPYIEFHTEPPIRFKFSNEEDYRAVMTKITYTEWKTFDQS